MEAWTALHWLSPPADREAERRAFEIGEVVCSTTASVVDAYRSITDALDIEVRLTRIGASRGDLWGRLLLGSKKGFIALIDPDPTPGELESISPMSDEQRKLAEDRIRFERLGHEIAHAFFYCRKGQSPTRPPTGRPDPKEERACDAFGRRLYSEIKSRSAG
jgi:hypothetical protein